LSDTPDIKEVKDEVRSLVEKDSDEAFEILASTSSRTFSEMEEEVENTQNAPDTQITDDSESKTRKYFGKMKSKLKKVAKWLNENKDKTLDDIMVKRWKEKCSEESLNNSMAKCKRKAQKKKRLSAESVTSKCKKHKSLKIKDCLEAGIPDKAGDTAELQQIKNELRDFFLSDPDEAHRVGYDLAKRCLCETCQGGNNVNRKKRALECYQQPNQEQLEQLVEDPEGEIDEIIEKYTPKEIEYLDKITNINEIQQEVMNQWDIVDTYANRKAVMVEYHRLVYSYVEDDQFLTEQDHMPPKSCYIPNPNNPNKLAIAIFGKYGMNNMMAMTFKKNEHRAAATTGSSSGAQAARDCITNAIQNNDVVLAYKYTIMATNPLDNFLNAREEDIKGVPPITTKGRKFENYMTEFIRRLSKENEKEKFDDKFELDKKIDEIKKWTKKLKNYNTDEQTKQDEAYQKLEKAIKEKQKNPQGKNSYC